MFISSYTTTSFYEKKFIYLFFRMFIFQWIQYSNVFICNFSLRMGPSIKYVHNWQLMEDIAGGVGWGGGGVELLGSSKTRTTARGGKGCHVSFVRTHLHYLFSCFWQHFCLTVSCLIYRNLILPLFIKDVLMRNGYFSPTRSISVVTKYAFLIMLKIIFASQS